MVKKIQVRSLEYVKHLISFLLILFICREGLGAISFAFSKVFSVGVSDLTYK